MAVELLNFQRPARYIGKEMFLRFKPPVSGDVRVCLCFPEVYEVGMSYLGFRIIHEIFATAPRISCERCFLPGEDMRMYLAQNKAPLVSVETATPLAEFDVVALCINCEVNLVNAVSMLQLAGIDRSSCLKKRPLIIAGGLVNPEPIADTIDAFFIGEFEASAQQFCNTLLHIHTSPPEDLLNALKDVPGVYVPSLYMVDGSALRPIRSDVPATIKRAYVADLDSLCLPRNWVMPYIETVFDRIQVEIQRGCPNQCKFCQAREVYKPYRERSPENVLKYAIELCEKTGHEEMSLLGLSVVDYTGIDALLSELVAYCRKNTISLGIPSLKPVPKAMDIVRLLSYARKPGLTFAVETADDALRKDIGKYINFEHVRMMIAEGIDLKYRSFKFYFMTGLPGESEEHAQAIAELLMQTSDHIRRTKGMAPQFSASVNCFMPKPFSAFATTPLLSKELYNARIGRLLHAISRYRSIKILYSDYEQIVLETILARGDRRLLPVIERVARMAVLNNKVVMDIDTWRPLFAEHGIDTAYYTDTADSLPRHIEGCTGHG
jgi:radical SAM superfamily enzyme YgiQ (UPF0313 family)